MKSLATYFQRSQIYERDELNSRPLTDADKQSLKNQYGLEYQEFKEDGKLHRFLIRPAQQEASGYTMFLGGSDLNLLQDNYTALFSHNKGDHGLIIPIYPGFHEEKLSNATEQNITNSVEKIYHHLKTHNIIGSNSLNLVGYSLGCPIAAKLASENKELKNITLVSPPSSVREVSIDTLSRLTNGFLDGLLRLCKKLLGEKYDTISYLKNCSSEQKQNTKILIHKEEDFYAKKGIDGKTNIDRITEQTQIKAPTLINNKVPEYEDPHYAVIRSMLVNDAIKPKATNIAKLDEAVKEKQQEKSMNFGKTSHTNKVLSRSEEPTQMKR